MRDDFSKVLVERERHRHGDHFTNYRHLKVFKDQELYYGGREGMKVRYNHGYDRKSFNENLNPLRGWLRSCIGKKWDKCYSELRKKFDARSVVNNHILEHLFDYIETNTFVGDKGQVLFHASGYRAEKGPLPIKQCYKDYYVCPKDGTLKKTQKIPRRSILKQKEAETIAESLKVKRVLDDGSELHLVNGIWFHFTFAILPVAKVVYQRPYGVTSFECGGWGKKVLKTWDELNESERARHGRPVYDVQGVTDLLTGKRVVPSTYNTQRYAITKQTASNKILKQLSIDGTGVGKDEVVRSHRELSKYRKAA